MALSVLVPCPLTELSTWITAVAKFLIASAILRDTVTTSTEERCAWDSGSAIAPGMETLMGTQDGIQYPGSLSKKFLKLKFKVNIQIDTTENSQIPQLVSFSLVIVRVQAATKYQALKWSERF